MMRLKISAVLLLAILCAGASGLPEGMGGQTFHEWTGFSLGSSATLESTSENPRGVLSSTTEQKLVEKTADHLVLEISPTVFMSGKTEQIPPTKMTVSAASDPTVTETQVGSEDVAAAGKTFSCKIFAIANSQVGQNLKLKIWVCSDVPGGIVKMEMDGPSIKIRSTLKSLDVK